MSQTYYEQSRHRPKTMTVGELIDQLRVFDPAEPVIFKSPEHGAYGPLTAYSIDAVNLVDLDRREHHYEATTTIDDETGEEVPVEAWTQTWEPWRGVVIE
jgi:hypothetical protein